MTRVCRVAECQGRFPADPPAAPFGPAVVPGLVDGLLGRNRDQQPPQVVAVGQVREPPLFGGMAERGKGTQGQVFFVGRAAGQRGQPLPCQTDQLLEIPPPEGIDGLRLPLFGADDPLADGGLAFRGHGLVIPFSADGIFEGFGHGCR